MRRQIKLIVSNYWLFIINSGCIGINITLNYGQHSRLPTIEPGRETALPCPLYDIIPALPELIVFVIRYTKIDSINQGSNRESILRLITR